MRVVDLVCRQDPRQRVVLGLAAGGAVFFASRGHVRFSSAAIAGWNAFAAVILALDWLTILMTPQRKMRERAQQQDLSRLLIFLFVVFLFLLELLICRWCAFIHSWHVFPVTALLRSSEWRKK